MATTHDLRDQYTGDTFFGLVVTVQLGGVAVNLSGSTVRLDFRLRSTNALAKQLAIGSGLTLSDPAAGIFTVDSNWTVDMDPGVYIYDCEVLLSTGRRETILQGTLTVLQDVTR